MSAWWMFGALGLYPTVPGTDVLTLGSPLFPHATITLPSGRLLIRAPRASAGTPYVRSATLDRHAWAGRGSGSAGWPAAAASASRSAPTPTSAGALRAAPLI